MNRIDFPRTDVYGKEYKMADLETWYVSPISTEINDRLVNDVLPTTAKGSKEEELTKRVIWHLPQILVMTPVRMERYTKAIDKIYGGILVYKPKNKPKSTSFGKRLIDAFNYEGYRKSKLVELSAWLNVKTCPYCNMSYTLYSEDVVPGKKRVPLSDKLARFQFDHFFSKRKYPMLSMCLYNLIPACSTCNQGKSDKNLSLLFHPYHSAIQSLFSFQVTRPTPGFYGARIADYAPVHLKWVPGVPLKEQKDYEDTYHLAVLYSRHGDIVQEVYDKTFEDPYYSNEANFMFLSNRGKDYLKRLWFDDYMKPDLIHRRPLSKFKQDVFEQASRDKKLLEKDGLL